MDLPVESDIDYGIVPKMGTLCAKNGKNNSAHAGSRGWELPEKVLAQILPHSVFKRLFLATAH
jgi:hypothetical protein